LADKSPDRGSGGLVPRDRNLKKQFGSATHLGLKRGAGAGNLQGAEKAQGERRDKKGPGGSVPFLGVFWGGVRGKKDPSLNPGNFEEPTWSQKTDQGKLSAKKRLSLKGENQKKQGNWCHTGGTVLSATQQAGDKVGGIEKRRSSKKKKGAPKAVRGVTPLQGGGACKSESRV